MRRQLPLTGGRSPFLGKNGYGKSTLAYFFVQKGHALVTDDLLASRQEDGCISRLACMSVYEPMGHNLEPARRNWREFGR